MALLKRQLHSRRGSAASLDGDWWYLVFDTETKRLCVEHEWGKADGFPARKSGGDTVELEITSYLATREEGPGQAELVRLIKTMFEDHT